MGAAEGKGGYLPACSVDNLPPCSRCCDSKHKGGRHDEEPALSSALTGRTEQIVEPRSPRQPGGRRGGLRRRAGEQSALDEKTDEERFQYLKSKDLHPQEFEVVLHKKEPCCHPGFAWEPASLTSLRITYTGDNKSPLNEHNLCARAAAKRGLPSFTVPIKSEIVKVNGAMGTAQELEMIMHNEKVLVLTIRLPAKRPTYKS